jgi:hypothetical protein
MKTTTNPILEQKQHLRTKCLVYTRVMGYHRPVESFNIGLNGEHEYCPKCDDAIIEENQKSLKLSN